MTSDFKGLHAGAFDTLDVRRADKLAKVGALIEGGLQIQELSQSLPAQSGLSTQKMVRMVNEMKEVFSAAIEQTGNTAALTLESGPNRNNVQGRNFGSKVQTFEK